MIADIDFNSYLPAENMVVNDNDYDDETSLSEAIVQLQNVDTPSKQFDATTMQMLLDHGISMLPQDEHENNSMLHSALQSGRKLVLSEAGKLGLNDLKMKISSPSATVSRHVRSMKKTQYHPYQMASSVASTTSTTNTMQKTQSMVQRTNKIIKILSAEEFKQMCGGDISNAFRKYPTHEIKKIMCDDGLIK
jgi:GA-binding protein transcription factor, beta